MSAQNNKSNGRTLISGNAGTRIAQQLAADVIAKHVSATMLTRAGISEDTFVKGVRQMVGYSSHDVTIPARFGKRYDTRGEAVWGRPVPKKTTASKSASKSSANGKRNGTTATKGKVPARTRPVVKESPADLKRAVQRSLDAQKDAQKDASKDSAPAAA